MAESDEEKTAFHTSHGVYCYTKMPFGLKNAGATYKRLVDKAFDNQVGRNIEVYVDDLVIKSHTEAEMLRDIDETFRTLRKINMKLNPKKCTFGAVEGMFLGYMISPEGIKPCLDKTEVVLQLSSPRIIKEVQSLNGKLASLNRFLSKRGTSLQATKAALVRATPAGSTQTEGGTDCIHGSELNYTPIEKLVLSLVFAAKRLRRYFQAHPIAILADFLVENPDESLPDTLVVETPQEPWTLFTDGSSCVDGSGAGLILTSPEGTKFTYALRFQFTSSNNEAYFAHLSKQVLVEILKEKSIQEKEVTTLVEEDGPTWMTLIIEYLKERTLPDDRNEASKLRIKARQYELLEGVLYRRSFLKPWLRCFGPLQAVYVIREIHEGSYRTREGQVLDSRYGLFYEVDRGESRGDNHWKSGEEVRAGQHKERREHAAIREAKAKLQMTKYYNARVRGVTFRPGDFVYRSNDASHVVAGGKLGPKWEGPYEVTKALGNGAYRLRSMDDMILPRTWNIANLKKCYL
ncbi:reverse transcriptase domain-containing protein [Tanacetum coccineum]